VVVVVVEVEAVFVVVGTADIDHQESASACLGRGSLCGSIARPPLAGGKIGRESRPLTSLSVITRLPSLLLANPRPGTSAGVIITQSFQTRALERVLFLRRGGGERRGEERRGERREERGEEGGRRKHDRKGCRSWHGMVVSGHD
jgi:hypothetical protein